MKKFLNVLFIIIPFLSISQKQGNIWYFAGNNGIDFNSGTPVLLTNGQIPSTGNIEGTATISDSSGNLLFYATAKNIWNKNHQLMLNGTGLLGGESATQGVFIAPLPVSDSLFYVFTLDEMQNCFQNGLRYSIVNMCLDNGLGAVDNLYKNILLLDSAGEKLACTFHSNGTDIWLVAHKYFSDAFYSYLLTANGIADTVISHVGSYHPADSTTNCMEAIGQMKISPDGSKLALVNANALTISIAELFDFDKNSGVVSNRINLQPTLTLQYYGVSFSSDNSKLYISNLNNRELYQYDLSSGIASDIIASKTIIYSSNSPITGLQLGPDGKIYVVNLPNFLGVISNPNNLGLSCGYIQNGFNLNNIVSYSLPNFIDSYTYHNGIPCDTSSAIAIELKSEQNIILYQNIPNPFGEETTINYYLPETVQNAKIVFYDNMGRVIKEVVLEQKGNASIIANSAKLSSGIYSYSIIIDGKTIDTIKMQRIK